MGRIGDFFYHLIIVILVAAALVFLLMAFVLENRNQLAAASAISGVLVAYIVVGIWWVSRKL